MAVSNVILSPSPSASCLAGRQGGDGRGWGRGGGRGGRGGGRGGQGGRGPNNPEFADNGDAPAPQGGDNVQFQEINVVVGCIHGGASLPPSNNAGKRLVRKLNAVASAPPKPLEWSNQVITFDPKITPTTSSG